MNEKQIKFFSDMQKNLLAGVAVQPEELMQIVEVMLEVIKQLQTQIDSKLVANKGETDQKHSSAFSELQRIESRMEELSGELDTKMGVDISTTQKQLLQEVKRVEQLIPQLPDLTPIDEKIMEIESKIPKLPEEITAEQVRDKLESIEEEDEKLDISAIKNLRKELDELKKTVKNAKGITIFGGGGGSGGGRIVKMYDLSSSLNGVLKTFSLPAFWRVINVISTSSPIAFRPTTDYTTDASLMTLTFTSEITASTTLAAGQTLLVEYSE